MSPRSIREYAEAVRPTYRTARKREKTRILTEFCRVTGYHRKSAIRLLRRAPTPSPSRRGRPPHYSPAVARARQVWETSDYLCSKRLKPFLPELLAVLARQHELVVAPPIRRALLRLSPATIDRLLKPLRPKGLRRPHLPNPAAPTLRAQVPIRTSASGAASNRGPCRPISSPTAASASRAFT